METDRTEPADDGCGGYAERFDGVSDRAASSGDRTQLGVVPVRHPGGQSPQLGGPAPEAAEPTANGGGGQAQRCRDATVTEAVALVLHS